MSGRCYECVQENCGYGPCSCYCHLDDETRPPPPEPRKVRLTKTQYVAWNLRAREVQSASEIHESVAHEFSGMPSRPTITLAAVSSILNRFVKQGLVARVPNWGPRGGYGYVFTKKGFEKFR